MIDILENGGYNVQWLKELEQLPDLEQLERNLNELVLTDKTNLSQTEIHELFYKKVILFANQSQTLDSQAFNRSKIWRVRKDFNGNEDLTSPKTFSYPERCLANGRCHLKDHPVFYGSLNGATAIFEVKPYLDQIVYISEWEANCDRDVKFRTLIPEITLESNRLHSFAQKQSKVIEEMSQLYGQNKAPHLKMIAQFIGNYFIQEESPYHLTSWLSNKILFDSNNLDFFLYASAISKTGNLNIAIKPTFVDRFLKILRVYEVGIISIMGTAINFGLLNTAENIDGTLIWRLAKPSDGNYLH